MAAKLIRLCYEGDLEGVRAALQSGVDVNSKDEGGQTGLLRSLMAWRFVVKQKPIAVASLLLEQEDIDVNISDDFDQTALHFAAMLDRNNECLAKLLARQDLITVNQRDPRGRTPLWWAVRYNAVRCVQLLLSDVRTDPNIKDGDGESPLMVAVKCNLVACVKLLLVDPRVDLMTRDRYKRSEEEVAR